MIDFGFQESVLEVAQLEKSSGASYADDFGQASGYIPYTDTQITEIMLTPDQRGELGQVTRNEDEETYLRVKKSMLTRFELDWWKSGNHLVPEAKLERDLQYLQHKYDIQFGSR
jgi:hypothetical protein